MPSWNIFYVSDWQNRNCIKAVAAEKKIMMKVCWATPRRPAFAKTDVAVCP